MQDRLLIVDFHNSCNSQVANFFISRKKKHKSRVTKLPVIQQKKTEVQEKTTTMKRAKNWEPKIFLRPELFLNVKEVFETQK